MRMRFATLACVGLALTALAACGGVRPQQGSGAARAPAQNGGLAGPQEGSPGNAHNIGTDSGTIAK